MRDSDDGVSKPSRISPVMAGVLERLSRKPKEAPQEVGPTPSEVEGRLRRAGIERRLLTASAGEVPATQRSVLAGWLTTAEERLERGNGLYMWGPVGTGKSMAAVAVCRELAKITGSVRWWQTSDLLMSLGNPYHRQDMMRELFGVRVLVLDDFGTQTLSAKHEEYMDQIADARYRRRRTTIVTTNVQPGLIGLDRVMDRWKSTMIQVEFSGRSRREYKDG